MTQGKAKRSLKTAKTPPLLLVACFIVLLCFSPQIAENLRAALLLCYQTIIPTLFPFMILLGLLATGSSKKAEIVKNSDCFFLKWFGVPTVGMEAFLMGALCGFPLGVKYTADLYRAGRLTEKEADQLLSFVNNTGPAFLIAGIGAGLFDKPALGLLLYLLQLSSALLTGVLLHHFSPSQRSNTLAPKGVESGKKNPNLVLAIQHSTHDVLGICGIITAFSIPLALLQQWVRNDTLLAFITSFLEIGNASRLAAALWPLKRLSSLLTLNNAVCFGGLSVHLQAAFFLNGLPLSLRRHTVAKLIQALLSSLLLLALCFVFSAIYA